MSHLFKLQFTTTYPLKHRTFPMLPPKNLLQCEIHNHHNTEKSKTLEFNSGGLTETEEARRRGR